MESKWYLSNFFGIIMQKVKALFSPAGHLGCSSVDYRYERYVQNKVKGHTKDRSVWRRRDALIVSIRRSFTARFNVYTSTWPENKLYIVSPLWFFTTYRDLDSEISTVVHFLLTYSVQTVNSFLSYQISVWLPLARI